MKYLKYFILFLPLMVRAADQVEFEQANNAFEEQQYEEALKLYKKLQETYPEQHELHFNLGNTYFYLDSLGLSVLHFEKALKYDPGSERALHNLQLAYLKSDYAIEPLPKVFFVVWWEKYLAKFTLQTWAKLTVLFMWLGVFVLIINYFKKKRTLKFFAFLSLTIGFWLVFTTYKKAKFLSTQQYAIVMPDSLPLQASPDEDAEDILVLHEGMKVEILDSLANWVEVQFDEDAKGWVIRDRISPI